MNSETANAIAVSGLQYLAGDEEQLLRFLALTGMDAADIRSAAARSGFRAAVLDFFLGHEPTLLAFAASAGIKPEHVKQARFAIAPPDGSEAW